MTPPPRIAVGVPSHGAWEPGFGLSLANMLVHCGTGGHGDPFEIQVFNAHGCVLPEVRTLLVAEAVRWQATHLLFLDSDMRFPATTLRSLLRHGAMVVGANYVRRGLPTFPTAYLPGGDRGRDGVLWTEPGDQGLVEVAHVGTGVMLIDMRLFDCLDLPFFDFVAPGDPGQGWQTDDVYFCRKVREAGIPIFCDQLLSQGIGHIGRMTFTHAMGLECRRQEDAGASATPIPVA
jgi:hypothetical protein